MKISNGKVQDFKLGVKLKKEEKPAKETFIDYSENSSLHGISYAFERSVHSCSRIFWILTFLGFFTLAVVMIYQLYSGWASSPVLTTLEDPAYPVTKLQFPAIIICGQGATDRTMKSVLRDQIVSKLKAFTEDESSELDKIGFDFIVEKIGLKVLRLLYPGIGTMSPMTMVSLFKSLSPEAYLRSETLLKHDFQEQCSVQGSVDESGDDSGDESDDDESAFGEKFDLLSPTTNGGCGEKAVYDNVNEACYVLDDKMHNWEDAKKYCERQYLMTNFLISSDSQLVKLEEYIKQGNITMKPGIPVWTGHLKGISLLFEEYGMDLNYVATEMLWVDYEKIILDDTRKCLTLEYNEGEGFNFIARPADCHEKHQTFCESAAQKPINCSQLGNETHRENLVDLILNPRKSPKTRAIVGQRDSQIFDQFLKLDPELLYQDLMESLWKSQLPCFDTSSYLESPGELSLLKQCYWKSELVHCASIFTTIPTDRGMCCSFNMQKANEMLNPSPYVDTISHFQELDRNNSYWNSSILPEGYVVKGEPKPKQGISKGLTLLLDAHTDMLDFSTVNEDFQAFIGMVNAKDVFPVTDHNNIKILPGHENFVAISAFDVKGTVDFRDNLTPESRNCYYPDEKELVLFQNYSQDACTIECQIEYAMGIMYKKVSTKCTPWYLPKWPNTPICNPWNAKEFRNYLKAVPDDLCDYCKPDCEKTTYSTKTSQAKFRRCDNTNLGLTELCTLDDDPDPVQPAIYGDDLLLEYENTRERNAKYVTAYKSRTRTYNKDFKNEIFYKTNLQPGKATYDAYEKDIGKVHFYFDQSSVIQYVRQPSMTMENFLGQVGGLLGLCIGLSFLSIVELFYWMTFRIWWSPKKKSDDEEEEEK